MRLRAVLIAVALALASTASAQNLRSLPLATSTTGGNDALLTLVSDSAYRTRAMTLVQFRKALSVTAFDSLITTKLNLTGATVTGAPTWSSLQAFATGQRVDSATGAARAQKLTTARTIAATGDVTYTSPSFDGSGNVTATATVNAAPAGTLTGAALAAGITSSSLTSFGTNARTDSATGAARSQTLTTARALWGQNFDGSAAITGSLTSVGNITGGASNMTLQSGTGNSRQLALQTTTSGGTATTALRFNEVQQALFTDGNSTRPGIAFATDSTMGMYRLASTQLAFRVNSADALKISTAQLVGLNGTALAPTFTFTGSATMGLYRFGADTLGFASAGVASMYIAGGANPAIVGQGAGGQLNILAGTHNNVDLFLQSSNASGVATTFLRGQGTQIRAAVGSAALPSFTFDNSNTSGLYYFGADTLGIAIAGANAFQIPALGKLVGGAGNMILTAGTGNSRTLTLQTTTSAGTAKNTLVLGADTSATFLGAGTFGGALSGITSLLTSDTITMRTSVSQRYITATQTGTGLVGFRVNRTGGTASDWLMYSDVALTALKFYANSADRVVFGTDGTITPATDNASDLGSASKRWSELYLNPAASGVGDTYICLSTGQQVHSGATCAASTLKMKDSVVAYTNADAILKLRPVTFNFKAGYYGQRAEIGLIAEEAALVDPRFVFAATKYDTLSAVAPTIALNTLTQKLDTTAVVIKPGEPEALNVSSIVAALVAQVQVQKRQLDSLSAVVFTLQQKAP